MMKSWKLRLVTTIADAVRCGYLDPIVNGMVDEEQRKPR